MATIKIPNHIIESFKNLESDLREKVFDAIYIYHITGVVPTSSEVRCIFLLVKDQITITNEEGRI